jgi:hypothetical protein
MPYRPSYARFELDAGSAISGVLPASVVASGVGTLITALVVLPSTRSDIEYSGLGHSLSGVFGLSILAIFMMVVGTLYCAFYIGIVGLPIAALMGRNLERPQGLAAAFGAAFAGALLVTGVFGFWPFGPAESWPFGTLVLTYSLPAGVTYRRSVLSARRLSAFADLA